MTDIPQQVNDDSDLRRFFAIMEHMAEDDLGLYEYRLLGHYKRVCGANGGQCTEGIRTTASRIKGMSVGKVSEARRELERLGWINVVVHTHTSEAGKTVIDGLSITLVDRMAENVARYAKTCSSGEQVGVHGTNTGVQQVKQRRTRSGRTRASSSGAKKSKTIPAAVINPMKNAIVLAFGWDPETMNDDEWGKVQKAAKGLCQSGIKPEEVPSLFAFCEKEFDQFGPNALAGNVQGWRKSGEKVAKTPVPAETLTDDEQAAIRARMFAPLPERTS